METDPIRINTIEIENFRGFRTKQRLSLGGTAVIITGPNGTGKTSLFDALQWLLLGHISRLQNLSGKQKDYILNSWSKDGRATVSAELVSGSQKIAISRSGTSNESFLELREQDGIFRGELAQTKLEELLLSGSTISFEEAIRTSGLLQQDNIRAVIEDAPTKRYEHLIRFLGLETLPEFDAAAKQNLATTRKQVRDIRSKYDNSEAELKHAKEEVTRRLQQLETTPSVQNLRKELSSRFEILSSDIKIRGGHSIDPAWLDELAVDARRTRDRCEQLISRGRHIASTRAQFAEYRSLETQSVDDQIRLLLLEATSIDELLERAIRDRELAERTSSHLAELAALAIPLLSDICPICQQKINQRDVRMHLDEVVIQNGQDLVNLKTRVDDIRERQMETQRAIEKAQGERTGILREIELREQHARESTEWAIACEHFASGVGSLIPTKKQEITGGNLNTLESLRMAASEIERLVREASVGLSLPPLTQKIDHERVRVDALSREVELLSEQVKEVSKQSRDAEALSVSLTKAIAVVIQRRFETIEPLVTEIYSRLEPHPAFTKLSYDVSISQRRGIVIPIVVDELNKVSADPLLVFSSSQANVAALTFFLAMGWAAGPMSVPFLMLDDPLQAMDDINALGFADLCRHIRRNRQLIVSTHDRRLGLLLERKLAPREARDRTVVLKFVGWDRSGPQIEQFEIPAQIEMGEQRVLTRVS